MEGGVEMISDPRVESVDKVEGEGVEIAISAVVGLRDGLGESSSMDEEMAVDSGIISVSALFSGFSLPSSA